MASQPKSNAEVTYEDQQHINKFSKMHLRSKDILAEIKVKKVGGSPLSRPWRVLKTPNSVIFYTCSQR